MTALAFNSPIGLSLQGCISALARLLNFQESLSEFGAVEDDVGCTFNGIFCICFLGRRWKVASMETHKSSTVLFVLLTVDLQCHLTSPDGGLGIR